MNSEKGRDLFSAISQELDFMEEVPQDSATGTNTNFYHPTLRPVTRDRFYKNIGGMNYGQFRRRIFFDKTSRMSLITSLYGRFMPESIRRFIRSLFR